MAAPKFSDLNPKLSTEALNSLESFGFKQTTPVQAATIPLFLSHKVSKKEISYNFLKLFKKNLFKILTSLNSFYFLFSLSFCSFLIFFCSFF